MADRAGAKLGSTMERRSPKLISNELVKNRVGRCCYRVWTCDTLTMVFQQGPFFAGLRPVLRGNEASGTFQYCPSCEREQSLLSLSALQLNIFVAVVVAIVVVRSSLLCRHRYRCASGCRCD